MIRAKPGRTKELPGGAAVALSLPPCHPMRIYPGPSRRTFSVWLLFIAVIALAAPGAQAQAPVIIAPPLSKIATVGQPVNFTVTATGAAPLTYSWKRNGQTVAGATSATLSIAAPALTDGGWYQLTVANELGSVKSVFQLTVAPVDALVVDWGANGVSGNPLPVGLKGVVAVAAGYNHSLALKADGTVVAWGDNGNRQATVPEGLSGVVAVAAGESHSAALKADGTVVTWGYI